MSRPPSNPYNVSKSDIKECQAKSRVLRDQKLEARIIKLEESVEWIEKVLGAKQYNIRREIMDKILYDIKKELEYVGGQWGTDFDDKNTINDWISYICDYASSAGHYGTSPEDQRKLLVKAAGLAVSALRAFDRNNGFPPRHYD